MIERLRFGYSHRIMVSNMIKAVQQGKEQLAYAMLWLATYTFLLRMPSEVG